MAPVTAATACRDTAVLQCHTSHQHKDRSIVNVINSDADLTFSRKNIRFGVDINNGDMQVQMDLVPELDKIN